MLIFPEDKYVISEVKCKHSCALSTNVPIININELITTASH